MSFSYLLFYVVLIFSVLLLASIANSLIGGRMRPAWTTSRVLLIVVALYATVLIATTLALPIRVLAVGEAQFSGNWSIAVESVRRVPHDLDEEYEIDFRLSNRGSTPINGEKKLTVYLLSENGTRYDPSPQPSSPPFDVPINPGKSVITTRRFVLPTNLNRVELVVARQGFRGGWFVIGRSPFDGRTVVALQ